jgi:transposase
MIIVTVVTARRYPHMARKPIPVEPHIDKIEQALLLGATYELAAKYTGVSEKTFERWRRRAEYATPGTALAKLRARLDQAEARAALTWLAQIEQAARNGDWRAAAFKLQHRYPEQYGGRVHADVTLQIQKAAQEVADEIGIDVGLVLKEAQSYLLETRRGDHPR